MVDKVQKIREEVERIQLYTQSEVLKQVLDYIDEMQKEPVNEDFEKTFISMVNATHENNGSYSLHDFAQRLYNIAKEELEEPVSEDLEEAADVYSKVFSDIAAPYIRKDAFIAGAKWQKQQEYTCYEEAFEDGAKWKAEQFEKERLKHCDELTEAQAQIESDFVTQHLKENKRTPTFIDAIEYGMRLKEKEMQSTIELAEDHAMLAGMEKMKEEMMKYIWKPADGYDLPDIDREVISILDNGKVVFAHRPNPNGWDGMNVTTLNIEHYTPKTYDKGGWNIPDVKFWLDVELPKEIEL